MDDTERLARVMLFVHYQHAGVTPPKWEDVDQTFRDYWLHMARAIVAAGFVQHDKR